jgi:hypothetical protein
MAASNLEQAAAARMPESIVLGAHQRAVDHTPARIKITSIHGKGEIVLFQKLSMVAVILGIGCSFAAAADESLASFKGGIGVIPVSSAAGAANTDGTSPNVNTNAVRGVNAAGQIWVIADLRAEISVDGHIRVEGKGLLLGGGNAIGATGGQSVFATLICEAAAPFTLHNTTLTGVPLEQDGDFQIDDVLTPAPADCASPVLLIRNVAGAWFAAGIPALANQHH